MPVTFSNSVLLTLATVLLSIGGLLLFRRFMAPETLKQNHDVADPYSQFVGMLFAVLLGFMVADAMQRFGSARQMVEQEASSVGNVFRLADGLPDAPRLKIQGLCMKYLELVIDDEWPLLAEHKTSIPTWMTYKDLWKACVKYDPVTPRECDTHQAMLPHMADVGTYRRLRVDALHNGLPPVLWWILGVGGIATIIFTYFFNVEHLRLQIVMVSIVSLVICLNIFLLACYDDPFSGDMTVSPGAFQMQLDLFKAELEHKIPKSVEAE